MRSGKFNPCGLCSFGLNMLASPKRLLLVVMPSSLNSAFALNWNSETSLSFCPNLAGRMTAFSSGTMLATPVIPNGLLIRDVRENRRIRNVVDQSEAEQLRRTNQVYDGRIRGNDFVWQVLRDSVRRKQPVRTS